MTAPTRAHAVPMTLQVVTGVFAGSALITFLTAFGSGFAVLALPVTVVAGALTTLAVRLYLGGRVARALAPAVAGILLLSAITAGVSAWWVVVGLVTTAASVVLLLAPSVRAFFAGPAGRVPQAGVSVTLVQVVAHVLGGFLVLATLVSFGFGLVALGSGAVMGAGSDEIAGAVGGLVGMAGGLALATAVFYAGLAAFWIWAGQALSRRSRGARIAISVVCGLNVLPSLLYLAYLPGLTLVSFVVFGAIAGALWLPADARRHFGEAPLPVVERWRHSAVTFGATVAAHAPTVGSPTATGPAAGPTPWHHGPGVPGPGTPPGGTWRAGAVVTPLHVVPQPRTAPSSGPVPVADLEEDPVTAPVRLGRHARPDVGPAQPV